MSDGKLFHALEPATHNARLPRRSNFGRVCLSVCLSVSQTITVKILDEESLYLHTRYTHTPGTSAGYTG